MNSAPASLPGFRSLYRLDYAIRRAVTVMILGLMLGAGIWWVTQPMPNAAPMAEPTPEVLYAPWISAGGFALAALAGAFVAWRYLLLRKILSQGTTITGTVELADVFDTNSGKDTYTTKKARTYVYYVTIRYTVQGTERKARIKLPHTPSTYGLKKGGETDLIVLDTAPRRPLIRAVYLGRTGL